MTSRIIFILFAFSFSVFSQSVAKVENDLVDSINEVQKYSTYGDNYDEELLDKANQDFETKLLKYTKNIGTLRYKFPKLGDLIIIATSADGKFRSYSWDTETGGTMHDYNVVYQYIGQDGKVYSKSDKRNSLSAEDGGVGSFIYSIFSLNKRANKIYIVCSTFIGGNSDHYGSAELYTIKGPKLVNEVKLFKTRSGLTTSIDFEYNFFSVVNRPERPIQLISFEEKTKTLKIPVVIKKDENDYGTVTGKFIKYRFNGTYFVKVK